jgi:hypothetical protein
MIDCCFVFFHFLEAVNIPNDFGETLIHEAAFRGNLVGLKTLLEMKAQVAVRTK